ncbi:hypothetical protein TNCV_1319221 [Trichonephila clavipes]|nr:hypothetical protein TNCV_1319221 [Trichonephila clavipes]
MYNSASPFLFGIQQIKIALLNILPCHKIEEHYLSQLSASFDVRGNQSLQSVPSTEHFRGRGIDKWNVRDVFQLQTLFFACGKETRETMSGYDWRSAAEIDIVTAVH